MAAPWINVQPNLTAADVPDLRRFGGALCILDWPGPALTEMLATLDAAGVPVRLWRWTEDPSGWTGWPGAYLRRCDLAVAANEPDIEGMPDWYGAVTARWRAAGGKVAEPAWHDERSRDRAVAADVLTAHCYSGDFRNLAAVRARAGGLPILVTEYAHQGEQRRCLTELAAASITEPTAIFIYRWQGHAADGYDVAGVQFDPPAPTKGLSVTITPAPAYAFQQAPGSLDCWVRNFQRFISRYAPWGLPIPDLDTAFQFGKGHSRPEPYGEAADFATFRRMVEGYLHQFGISTGAPAGAIALKLQLLEIDDFTTLLNALHDSDAANPWSVVIGENNAVENPNSAFQHYETIRLQDGTNGLWLIYDPAASWDGNQAEYSWDTLTQAIQQNWDSKIVGYAMKLVAA